VKEVLGWEGKPSHPAKNVNEVKEKKNEMDSFDSIIFHFINFRVYKK